MTIARRRLVHQRLVGSAFTRPDEAVAWLGAVQAQDYPGAKWSLGLRLPGSTEANIEAALTARAVVRTWALRGTLHFLAAADLRRVVALVAPAIINANARRYRELELDPPTMARANDLLAVALRGGVTLDRKALLAGLETAGISTAGQRGVYLLQRASLDGLIGQGPMVRNVQTFYAVDALPADPRTFDAAEVAADLARRYFTSHGPATAADFIWWSGLPAAEARAALETAAPALQRETLDGAEFWFPPDSVDAQASGVAHLLPGFDEFLVAYKGRSASLAPEHVTRWNAGGGMLNPTVVVDGRVIGLWKRALKKDRVEVAFEPFWEWSGEERAAVEAAAEGYGEYLNMNVSR